MIITGLILLLAFVATVVLIIRGQSPIVMLLLLAIVWSAVAGIGVNDIQAKVLQGGGVAYASAVIIIVFGSWFAQVLIQTGIAETVIRAAAELAGDRPVVTTMIISTVIALLFTSMYGVGAAIAIGVIALPIMMAQGIPPVVAAPAFTMAIGAGTFVNLVNFGIMQRLFPGIVFGGVALAYWVIGGIVYLMFAWLLVIVNMRRVGVPTFLGGRNSHRGRASAHAALHLRRPHRARADDRRGEMGDHPDLPGQHRARPDCSRRPAAAAACKPASTCSTRRSTTPSRTSRPLPRFGPSAA